jgi:hypothetical protein
MRLRLPKAGRSGEVRFLGEIDNTPAATAKLVKKLSGKYDRLTFCYEAGPTGYGLHRQIKSRKNRPHRCGLLVRLFRELTFARPRDPVTVR